MEEKAQKNRPSAAACGFSTMGLSDKEVLEKLKAKPESTRAKTPKEKPVTRKDKAKCAHGGEDDGDDQSSSLGTLSPLKLDTSSSESSDDEEDTSSSTSNTGSSSSKKAPEAGNWPPRPELPKSNIRRWTTTRENTRHAKGIHNGTASHPSGEETKATGDETTKTKEGKETKTKEDEETGDVKPAMPKSKGKAKTGGAAGLPSTLPVPTHRRRTKSSRYPVAKPWYLLNYI